MRDSKAASEDALTLTLSRREREADTFLFCLERLLIFPLPPGEGKRRGVCFFWQTP